MDAVSDRHNMVDDEHEPQAAGAAVDLTGGLDVFTLISMLDTLSVSSMLEHRGTDSIKRRTCFITAADADRTFDVAVRVAGELRVVVTPNKPALKVRVETARSAFNIQVHKLTATNTLVEVVRRKGDVLDFVKAYEHLSGKVLDLCKK